MWSVFLDNLLHLALIRPSMLNNVLMGLLIMCQSSVLLQAI